ncbi:MAG: hypothetical protein ACI4EH_08710 [Oliverpabstia sp.]
MFETSQETISKQFFLLEKEALKLYPDMRIYQGCEFYANMDMINLLEERSEDMMVGIDYVSGK